MTTIENSWFGVVEGKAVTVVWSYLNYAQDWHDELKDPFVRIFVDGEHLSHHFPNYSALRTELKPDEVNILSNFSSWMLRSPAAANMLTSLYSDS